MTGLEEKKAVVFSGGGAKGGYQIGVWKALREIGFKPAIITGTSVGALNGALMALGKYDEALEIWENMGMKSVFSDFVDGINSDSSESDESKLRFIREVVRNRGADYTPLQELVKGLMEEDKLRSSNIEFGLVTTRFPIKAVKVFIEDIPKGEVADYVLASAAYFPYMKSYEIDNNKYVDGGYTDYMPVQMALQKGATKIVVVDLGGGGMKRLKTLENTPKIYYIKSKKPLGTSPMDGMIFSRERSLQNIQMGYLDTMKAFHKLDGNYYSFYQSEREYSYKIFNKYTEIYERVFSGLPNVTRFERIGQSSITNFLNNYIDCPFVYNSNILICAETAADIFGLDTLNIYTVKDIKKAVLENIKSILHNESTQDILNFSDILDKKFSLENIRIAMGSFDKKPLTAYAVQILLSKNIEQRQKRRLWILSALLPDVICASFFAAVSVKEDSENDKHLLQLFA